MPTAALALMLISMVLIPAGDTAGKLLMIDGVVPGFVGWSRFVLGASCVALWLIATGRWPAKAVWQDWRLWVRGALISGGILSILTALQTEPIANVFGAFFLGPIVSTLLSAWLLGERVSSARLALLVLGFMGVLLVVRPGFGMSPGLLYAVMAGLFYGAYLTASRWLRDAAPVPALLLTQLVTGSILLVPVGATAIPPLTGATVTLTVASGLASMLGNLLLILAYARAEAGRLAPFVYFQLVAATVLGLTVFGDWPDQFTLMGLALLTLSGFATLGLRR